MRRRLILAAGSLLAIAFGASIFLEHRRTSLEQQRLTKVRDDLQHIAQTGMNRAEIDAWLEQRGIAHSFTKDSAENANQAGTEFAMVQGGRTLLVREDLQITFRFNPEGKLTSYSAQPIFTGP